MRLLSVVLGAPDTTIYNNVSWYGHYADTAMLLEYGFGVLSGTIVPEPEASPEPEQTLESPETPEEDQPTEAEDPAEAPSEEPETPQLPVSEPVTSGLVTLDEQGQAEPREEPEAAQAAAANDEDTAQAAEQRHFPWGLLVLLILAVLVEACVVYILVYRHQYQVNRRNVAERKARAEQEQPDTAQYEDEYDYKV